MFEISSELNIYVERVTRIELALSAWESVPSGPVTWPDLRVGVSASDRDGPLVTGVNGPLMARLPPLAALSFVPCRFLIPGIWTYRPIGHVSTRHDDQAR